MSMSEDRFWNMPIGLFLDLWAVHKQFLGLERPLVAQTIDTAIPFNIA